jgi:hypothetical protein
MTKQRVCSVIERLNSGIGHLRGLCAGARKLGFHSLAGGIEEIIIRDLSEALSTLEYLLEVAA